MSTWSLLPNIGVQSARRCKWQKVDHQIPATGGSDLDQRGNCLAHLLSGLLPTHVAGHLAGGDDLLDSLEDVVVGGAVTWVGAVVAEAR